MGQAARLSRGMPAATALSGTSNPRLYSRNMVADVVKAKIDPPAQPSLSKEGREPGGHL
jgi:hypothetical protein